MTLDQYQQAVVDSRAPLRAVAAGPGSGKTRTLVAAVVAESGHTPPEEIVVITYTTAAAREITERLAKGWTEDFRFGYVGTLHGFLFRMLRQCGSVLGYSSSLGILDEDTARTLLRAIADQMGVRASEAALDHSLSLPESELEHVRTPTSLAVREFYHRCRSSGSLTFDMVLRDGVRLVKLQLPWHYTSLFYDEAQDGSDLDFEFIKSAPFLRKAVVGDGDQAIYGFRGGKPANFTALCNSGDWELHKLQANYRSAAAVCGAANALISHAPDRVRKYTAAVSGRDGLVEAHAFEFPPMELHWTAEWARAAHARDASVAVLCRTNREVQTFASLLRASGIPVREQVEEEKPEDWRLCKLLIAALAQPWSPSVVHAYVTAKAGPKVADRLRREAELNLKSLFEVYFGNMSSAELILHSGEVIPNILVGRLCAEGISEASIKILGAAITEEGWLSAPSLPDLLLLLGEREKISKEEGHGVTVCTIHAAKGREWDVVVMPGCEARKEQDSAEAEEARRLYYVGITRAKESIHLTWCRNRPQSRGPNLPPGPMEPREPSPFLREAGLIG